MSKLEQILAQEVTRKQFLGMLGLSMLALFGVTAILGIFSRPELTQIKLRDYGLGDYGP